jgi:hypothetical protein
MDHEIAAKMKAPERYVLGELPETERDEFEEHFAGCSACLEEVWSATAFAANARAVFRERANRQPSRVSSIWGRFIWQVAVPVLATLVLGALAIYQNTVTIPGAHMPRAVVPAIALDGITRSSLPQVQADAPLRFQLALSPAAKSKRVWVELTGDKGHIWSRGWVGAPRENEPLDLYFPVSLVPGRYTITVRAAEVDGAELARGRFVVIAG